MCELELGCCTEPEYLPEVASSGFDFAELRCETTFPTQGEQRWRLEREKLLSYQVPICSFNVLLPRGMHVVGPDVSMIVLREYLSTTFDRMSELGARHVSFGSGAARAIPLGFDGLRAEEQVLSFIELLEELSRPYSIQVNIEFLNRRETNLIVSLREAYRYTTKINKTNVRLLVDLYHIMEEAIPLSDLLIVAEHVGYVHVADSNRLYPGSGTFPYVEFFDTLRQIGYNGPVSVECRWDNRIKEMEKSVDFLKQLMNSVSS